jgi:hypothetical protein
MHPRRVAVPPPDGSLGTPSDRTFRIRKAGTRCRTRTCDKGIKSPLLYQLS